MSKTLAKLLHKSEIEMTALVRKLEDLNGYPSQDVRLIADLLSRSRQKTGQLSLDPGDTTAHELYSALLARFANDSSRLDKAVGAGHQMNLEQRQAKALQLIGHIGPLPEVWALKSGRAKKLLQANPPKKVMKQFNCRSLESFIKKADCTEVYLGVPYTESAGWQKSFQKALGKLTSADFEVRPARTLIMPANRWQSHGPTSPVIFNTTVGAVAFWPTELPPDTPVLSLCLYLLDGLHALTGKDLSADFYQLHPALRWWTDCSSLLSDHGDTPVSFNLRDVAASYLQRREFDRRSSKHGRQSLMRTLISRYERQPEEVSATFAPPAINHSRMPLAQLAQEYVTAE